MNVLFTVGIYLRMQACVTDARWEFYVTAKNNTLASEKYEISVRKGDSHPPINMSTLCYFFTCPLSSLSWWKKCYIWVLTCLEASLESAASGKTVKNWISQRQTSWTLRALRESLNTCVTSVVSSGGIPSNPKCLLWAFTGDIHSMLV